MKITLVQMDIVWADHAQNALAASRAIDGSPASDIYVLPEMWSTGFVTRPQGVAEPEEGQSLCWMKRKAASTGAAIVGSIAVQTDRGEFRNRMYFVKPDGEVTCYDKRHLFSYGTETMHYSPGDERVVVEYKGVRFLLQVCYDLRFPVWSRNRGDYDAVIYVASWPVTRIEVWRTLLKARAIENQCYAIGVNRIGNDPTCSYPGATAFVDPYGRAQECPDGEPSVITGEIDMDFLKLFRKKFPVLEDRDVNWNWK